MTKTAASPAALHVLRTIADVLELLDVRSFYHWGSYMDAADCVLVGELEQCELVELDHDEGCVSLTGAGWSALEGLERRPRSRRLRHPLPWKQLAKKLWRELKKHDDCVPAKDICPICGHQGWTKLGLAAAASVVKCTNCGARRNRRLKVSRRRRSTCAICGRDVALRQDGSFRIHSPASVSSAYYECAGSHRHPELMSSPATTGGGDGEES